jgi:ABC-type lipoprotein release transport system permease subunit
MEFRQLSSGKRHIPTPVSSMQARDGIPRHRYMLERNKTMNRFATIFSASALSAIAFGAESYAAMPHPVAGSEQQIENSITKLSPTSYNVVQIDSLRDDHTDPPFANVAPQSPEARLIQASVIANPALSRKLQAENVEIHNIVGAERAADGSVTFYIR